MFHSKRTHTSRQSGQSLVELALSLTVLLILLSGVVDLGRAFFAFMAMRDAAQEGALFGSLYPCIDAECTALNTPGIVSRVRNASHSPVDMSNTDITITPTLIGTALCQGSGIRVQVAWENFPLVMPFWQPLMGISSIPLRAQIEDTILRPPCRQ